MKINSGSLRATVLFSLLFLLCSHLNAQEYMAHVKRIGMEDGLSSYNIESIYQDADGFIWIGTDNGLNRWDGSAIKTYTKEENGLCHNFVAGIMEDRNGMLWITAGDKGGDRHYSVFNKYKEKFYSPEEYIGKPLPFKPQKTVAYECKGKIIFCEQEFVRRNDLIIYQYDGKHIRKLFAIKENNQTQGKILEGMFETGENEYISFWRDMDYTQYAVQTCDEKGKILKSFQKDQKHPLILGTRMHQNKYFVICAGQEGDYWNLDFHINGIQHQKQDIRVKANWAERIAISENRIYVLDADSIRIYNKDGTKHAVLRLGLSLKQIYFGLPFVDRYDNIWIHDQESVYCVSLSKKNFSVEVQNPGNPVRLRGIARKDDGKLVTGGVSFLLEQQGPNRWKSLLNLSHNYLGLLQNGDNLWLGTESFRLCKLNTRSLKMEEFPVESKSEKTHSGMIWMPFLSKDGRVWAGGNKGFYHVDEVKKILVPFKDANLGGISVYAFHQNKSGTWLCTSSGLMLVDLKKEKLLKQFNKYGKGGNFIPAEHITHLYEDKSGIFWLATKGDGLVRWNPITGEYRQYTQKKSGLSHNVLYAVYGDEYGYLWISSQRGLMRFHKETGGANVYLKEDGLPHNEFNTISHYQAPDGHLYFGGQNGMMHFHPKDFEVNTKKYPFLITGYSKQNNGDANLLNLTDALQKTSEITIRPNDRNITIKFALLDYHNSQNHLYGYQIKGYDDNWVYQTENKIRFNGLPYGTYELKLRAKNANASAWTDYPKTITIRVLKPFYLQLWFIMCMSGVIAIVVYAFFRWRLHNLEKGKEALEKVVKERTQKIENDKLLIEQQAAELRTLDELKSHFFSNISHELRTPLTLILGPLSYILDDPNAWEKESVREQLLVMQRNGKSLLGLIEEILDLSKLEANKMELQEDATLMSEFLEYIFSVFTPEMNGLQLDFELITEFKNKNLTVLIDRKKLEKVINNFLSNAMKFTPKNGKITLYSWEEENTIKIGVSDTGKGVHANDLPFIFDRFYQSKQADQKQFGGTGIGLALVSDFAKLMGGKAHAESTPGKGSKFYFEFPKKEVEPLDIAVFTKTIETENEELIEQIGYNFTILVVEDNKDMRNFICQLLQTRYKTVLSANNGEEGLQMLREFGTDIHLIISDVMMPELDGLGMLRQIKSNPQWMGIPVIMLTALAAERDKLTALTIGVDDYLTKPFSVNELLIRVQNLLFNFRQRQLFRELNALEMDESDKKELTPENADHDIKYGNLWIKEVESIVRQSLKKRIVDVEELSSELNISSRQLSRRITNITGLTPSKFIRELQLRSALKEMEDGTVLSIKEVCFNNGFEQPSTFSKLFKLRFGKNPSDYLKN